MLKEAIQAKRNSHPEWMTTAKERRNYYIYFCGQNMIYTLVTSFLSAYLLLSGVDTAKTAGVMLAVKIWDAVNDAIFGCIFDSVHFKSGKRFLPWLKISLPIIPITTIILFMIPGGASETVKLVWFAAAYMLWDTAYTLCDVPIYGLLTSMTDQQNERTSLLSFKSIWSGIGIGFAYLAATVIVSLDISAAFTIAAVVVGVCAFITMMPICKSGQERCAAEHDDNFTIRNMFKYLFSNKYLLIYYGGYFFYNALNTVSALNLLVSYFLFHNTMFSIFVTALSALPMLVFSLLVPSMVRRFGKMKIYLVCTLLSVIISTVMWLVGFESMLAFILLSIVRSVPTGIIGVMMFMFTPDCAEYGIFKTGIDAKGITFAIQTFMVKLTGAISAALGVFVLGLFSWQEIKAENFEQIEALGITQTPEALNGLWFTYMMLPVIGSFFAMIIWYFYKLNDNDVEAMAKCNNGDLTRNDALAMLSPAVKKEFEE